MAMLFGSMMSPAIAHAAGQDAAHLHESTHVDMDFDHEAAQDDHGNDSPDGPGNILPHHHCAAGFALIVPDAALNVVLDGVQMFRPHLAAAMVSWKTAPPTEPPAA